MTAVPTIKGQPQKPGGNAGDDNGALQGDMDLSGRIGQRCQKAVQAEHDHKQDSLKHGSSPSLPYYAARSHLDRQVPSRFDACHRMRNHVIIEAKVRMGK